MHKARERLQAEPQVCETFLTSVTDNKLPCHSRSRVGTAKDAFNDSCQNKAALVTASSSRAMLQLGLLLTRADIAVYVRFGYT